MTAIIKQIFKETDFLNEQHISIAGLLHTGSVVERYVSKALEQHGLPLAKYRILRGLRKVHPQGIGVYKLRDFLIGEKSDISRLVEKMVQRGLVERNVDDGNKSISQIVITPKGVEMADEIDKHMHEIISPAMQLTTEEARRLNELLEKVISAFPEL